MRTAKHKFRQIHEIDCPCGNPGGAYEGRMYLVRADPEIVWLKEAPPRPSKSPSTSPGS